MDDNRHLYENWENENQEERIGEEQVSKGKFSKLKWKKKQQKKEDNIDKGTKNKKRKTKAIVAVVLVAAIAAGGVFSFRSKGKKAQASGNNVMESKVQKGNISQTVEGTGTLANADSTDLKIPVGLKIKEVKVSEGDEVKKGDTLATVDKTSLLAALAQTQSELDDINNQLGDEADSDTSKYVEASVDGRVKKIYASKNTDAADTVLEKGALMLISLDGKMAVKMETTVSLTVGQEVKVVLSSGSSVTGTVTKSGDESCTITVTDKGTKYNDKVTAYTSSGTKIGTGKLYINKEAKVTATSGTVSSILVSENEYVYEGDNLLKLKGDFQSEEYLSLESEKEDLEEKLAVLLKIAKNNTITADSAGIITAVNVSADTESGSSSDSSSANSSSSSSGSSSSGSGSITATGTSATNTSKTATETSVASTSQIASATAANANGSISMANTVANTTNTAIRMVNAAASSSNAMKVVSLSTNVNQSASQASVQSATNENGTSVNAEENAESADDTTGTTADSSETTTENKNNTNTGTTASGSDTTNSNTSNSSTTNNATNNTTSSSSSTQSNSSTSSSKKSTTESQNNTGNSNGTTNQNSAGTSGTSGAMNGTGKSGSGMSGAVSGAGSAGMASGSAGTVSGNASGAMSGSTAGSSSSSTSTSLSTTSSTDTNTELTSAFSIASGDEMTLTVNVDEMDILSIETGQKATVTFDAIENKEYEGEITSIDKNGTTSNGTTKYPVEITVTKEDSMMSGMNASVTITTSEVNDALLVPAAAITEEGNTSYVYTEKDSKTGELSGKTEVQTGDTDGTNTVITSGLSEGDTIYYSMAAGGSSDNSSTDNQKDNQNGKDMKMDGNFGGGQGGGNGGGTPPSGGPGGNN